MMPGYGERMVQPLATSPPERARLSIILWPAALVAAAIFLPFLGSSRTLTPHEVIVTLPALEMLRDGHWLLTTYGGELWVSKPPLVSWMTAGCFAITGGFSEFAARLPAALSAIGLCVLAALLAWRCFGVTAGRWAGPMQATMVYMYMQGRLGEIDLPFAFILAGAHGILLWHWSGGDHKLPPASAAGFHALAGLGVLAKGPLAVALLAATVLAFCALRRSWRPLAAVLWTPGVVMFPLVGLWWYGVVLYQAGDDAWQQWVYANIDRFRGQHVHGSQSPLTYAAAIPWMILPWGLALLYRAPRLLAEARRRENHAQRYLWAWFLGGMAVLLASAMKHKHYAIPTLPPLTLLAAKLFAEDIPVHAASARRAARLALAAAVVIFAVVGGVIMPRRDHRRPTADFVRQATAGLPPEGHLFVAGLDQSAVYPYVQHRWELIHTPAELTAAIDRAGDEPVWVLTLPDQLRSDHASTWRFEEIDAEPVRARYPRSETLVLARVVPQAAGAKGSATRPAMP